MREIADVDIAAWEQDLAALLAQLGPFFRRSEVRARAQWVVRGLLGAAARKNGWQLAEAIGEDEPHGVQRLLYEAVWEADAVRDLLQTYVARHLGSPDGILVVDESGFLKKGTHSVGVARQYSGTAGKVENCQIGVFLSYAGPQGHAFLDRALYLPTSWTEDRERLRAAGVPEEAGFATKPELARRLLARARERGIPHAWVVGDHVYGDDGDLRADLEEHGEAYAVGISANHGIWDGGEGREARALVAGVPAGSWARLSAGTGSQGERLFDWCWIRLTPADIRGMARWLVARRTLGDAPEVASYRVFGPAEITLAALARVIGARWTIEECLEEAKGVAGLDQYEVRGWVPWHRHLTLAMLAHAFLAVARTQPPAGAGEKGGPRGSHGT